MDKKLEHLEALGREAEVGGREARLDAQQAKGKLLARQRVALLEHGGWGCRDAVARINGLHGRGLSAWKASGWPWQT
jgi:acetyl-CoA carboxylase carboxyltransferase component